MKEAELAKEYFQSLQNNICAQIEEIEGQKFQTDQWTKSEQSNISAGGGVTKVLNAAIFEQAGVNFSAVEGRLPKEMSSILTGESKELPFLATGISLVIHPFSPLVPTTHANLRYLEVGELAWFGGGMDLTPYYIKEEDGHYFHKTLKAACDSFDPTYYQKFKEQCDKYFYLPHRGECRGIGGIFFDYLGKNETGIFDRYFPFIQTIGPALMEAYLPIVNQRCKEEYTEEQKEFQLIRRGRYVEFNLIYDRGTKFGLETGGRTESILMSLPANVKWKYDFNPQPGSAEEHLIDVLKTPQDWI